MKTMIDGVQVEGTPEEIAAFLKISKQARKKKTYCACYEEDPTGYTTTYHRVGSGCSECRDAC